MGHNRRNIIAAALGLVGLGSIVTLRSDDLTDVLVAQPTGPAQPTGSAQPMTYGQGVIVTFNSITLENTVLVAGATLTNLPMLGVAEAATLEPKAVVGLMQVGTTWAIIGRIVTPGTNDAKLAVSLASAFTSTVSVAGGGSRTIDSFGDLQTGSPLTGPTVDIVVGPSRRVELTMSCTVSLELPYTASLDQALGGIGIEITGATIRAASETQMTTALSYTASTPTAGSLGLELPMSKTLVVENLAPGATRFSAQYISDGVTPAFFRDRLLTVKRL